MLKRHLLATTGVMLHTYNPNTTQESQKKRESLRPVSQGALVTPQLFHRVSVDMQGNWHPQTRKGLRSQLQKLPD